LSCYAASGFAAIHLLMQQVLQQGFLPACNYVGFVVLGWKPMVPWSK